MGFEVFLQAWHLKKLLEGLSRRGADGQFPILQSWDHNLGDLSKSRLVRVLGVHEEEHTLQGGHPHKTVLTSQQGMGSYNEEVVPLLSILGKDYLLHAVSELEGSLLLHNCGGGAGGIQHRFQLRNCLLEEIHVHFLVYVSDGVVDKGYHLSLHRELDSFAIMLSKVLHRIIVEHLLVEFGELKELEHDISAK